MVVERKYMSNQKSAPAALAGRKNLRKSTGVPLSAGLVLVTLGIVYGGHRRHSWRAFPHHLDSDPYYYR